MLNKSVAIIGAGLSAATCAKAINGLVKNISVFEQSPYVGGRLYLTDQLSTTASFTVSTPFFQQIVDHWLLEGNVYEKHAWNVEILGSETLTLNSDQIEYVVRPNMVELVKNLLEGITVRCNAEVVEMERKNNLWRLFDFDGGYLGQYDCVILSSSESSIIDLAKSSPLITEKLNKIEFSPVWNVVLTLQDGVSDPYDSALFIESAIASCYYDGSNSIVLMATPEWSEKYSALSKEQAAQHLMLQYCEHTQTDPASIVNSKAKFWLKKAPINTLGEDSVFDAELGLGACGDWCTAPRVEGAVLSGFSMADRVMKYFSQEVDV